MKSSGLIALALLLLHCAGNDPAPTGESKYSLISDKIRDQIQEVSDSVIGINTNLTYTVLQYNYVLQNGAPVPDSESPVKYKLESRNGESGVIVTKDEKTLSGGGLIIDIDQLGSRYTILTSSHLVSPADTSDIYYLDERGRSTDILFTRYVLKTVFISVHGMSNWRSEASLIVDDPVNDIAVLSVNTQNRLGYEFPMDIGYDLGLDWGDWVFLFGYPKGIKQLTGGWVSRSPYRNTMAVDAVVRFGYSGGPVFALSRDKQQLHFVGLVKSVPSKTLDIIAPDGTLPPGLTLTDRELHNLYVRREMVVEYGTAYFVHPGTIRDFFRENRELLRSADLLIPAKYFGE